MQNILIIDDHEFVIENAIRVLGDKFKLMVAKNADEMRKMLKKTKFALAVLDLDLGEGGNGINLLAELKKIKVPVIILSGTMTKPHLRTCLNFGIKGFVDKQFGGDRLVTAVEGVIAGFAVFPEGAMDDLYRDGDDRIPHLTKRERDVANQLFLTPMPDREMIAKTLFLSTGRVANLMGFIYGKLNMAHKDRNPDRLLGELKRRGYHPEKSAAEPGEGEDLDD